MQCLCKNPLAIAILHRLKPACMHARCCCMQLLTSIAAGIVPNGIICAWDHSMQLLTSIATGSILNGIIFVWNSGKLGPTWRPLPFVANPAHCLYAGQMAHCQPSHLVGCVPASAVLSLSVLHPAQTKRPHIKPTLSGVDGEAGRHTDRQRDSGRSQRDARPVRQVYRQTDDQSDKRTAGNSP